MFSNCYKKIGCKCSRCTSKLKGGKPRVCNSCNFTLKSAKCYDDHLLSTCQTKAKCPQCNRIVLRTAMNDHRCRMSYCTICHNYFPWDHVCFVQKPEIVDSGETQYYLFFDFETVTNSETKKIEPIFVHSVSSCEHCITLFDKSVSCCTDREISYSGRECLTQFVDYVLTRKNCLVLSFCGSRFDNILLFENFINRGIKCIPTLRGQNLLILKCRDIICKYVFLYLTGSLDSMAREFDLSQQKTFYPLNRLHFETLSQKLRLNKQEFNYNTMTPSRKKAFDAFYKAKVFRQRFNMEEELRLYCR